MKMGSEKRGVRSRKIAPLVGVVLMLSSVAASAAPEMAFPSPEELWEVLSLRNYNTRVVVFTTTLLGITAGLVGTFLLLRKRSLMGDALSHATLPGIGLAFLLMVAMGGSGKFLPGLLVGASVTGLLGVLAVLAIRNTTRLKDDAAMGIVLSVFFGVGVVILGFVQNMPGGSKAGLESFIYGKAASIAYSDLVVTGIVAGVTVLAALVFLSGFIVVCFDEDFAANQGLPVLTLDLLMLGLVTAVTVVGLQAVGLILIIAFLITPATAARFWTHSMQGTLWLAAVIGGVSGWLGSSLSALMVRLPTGAVIVLVAATLFLLSMIFGPARGVLPRYIRHARLRRKVGRQHLLRAIYEILEAGQSDPEPIRNLPIQLGDLLAHRSWSQSKLHGLLRTARGEDHLEKSESGTIRLSESGFGEAARVTRNHRLWELYLITHADIAPSHVDRDADLVEHVLGAEVVHQLEAELQSRKVTLAVPPSPHLIEQPNPGAS